MNTATRQFVFLSTLQVPPRHYEVIAINVNNQEIRAATVQQNSISHSKRGFPHVLKFLTFGY
jgi:hypothetical protein